MYNVYTLYYSESHLNRYFTSAKMYSRSSYDLHINVNTRNNRISHKSDISDMFC